MAFLDRDRGAFLTAGEHEPPSMLVVIQTFQRLLAKFPRTDAVLFLENARKMRRAVEAPVERDLRDAVMQPRGVGQLPLAAFQALATDVFGNRAFLFGEEALDVADRTTELLGEFAHAQVRLRS